MDRKRNNGNKAKGEPGIRLDHTARPVSTIMALAYLAFIALHLLPEGVLSACEYDTHC